MTLLNGFALLWFVAIWVGYTAFAKRRAKSVQCLSSELRGKRTLWMRNMLLRDNRISDASIVSTLERNVSFFASSSLLILAGLLTAISSSDKLSAVLAAMTPWAEQDSTLIQFKLLCLAFIYVFAFFQFTWSLRQYGFVGVLIGAAPDGKSLAADDLTLNASRIGKVIDQAGHSFNYGLRAIYFSLAMLSWFVDVRLFILMTVVVLLIMYHREYHSKALHALKDCSF